MINLTFSRLRHTRFANRSETSDGLASQSASSLSLRISRSFPLCSSLHSDAGHLEQDVTAELAESVSDDKSHIDSRETGFIPTVEGGIRHCSSSFVIGDGG